MKMHISFDLGTFHYYEFILKMYSHLKLIKMLIKKIIKK